MPPRSNGSVRSHHSGHSADKATKKAGSNGINAESVQGKERAPVAASSSDGSSEASTSRAPSDVEGSDGGTEGGHDGEDDGMSGSEASSSDEEDDDEDEEPTLRYSRITRKATSDIFARDSCSALAVSDTYLVVGTHNGGVVVFARPGGPAVTAAAGTNSKGKGKERQLSTASVLEEVEEGSIVIKRYRPHTASINDIVIDEDSQYIGTAATDGKIVILHLATSDAQQFDQKRPIRCLALEPSYATKSTRQFVSGGMAGSLILHEKGWLGPKDVTLHNGEGPIWSVKWRRNYIAWSNDQGVRIYDTHTSTRIAFIPRQENSPRADLFPCNLHWQNDDQLVIAWADFIKMVRIKERQKESIQSSAANTLSGVTAYVPGVGGGSSRDNSQPAVSAEVTNVLQLDCMISGICPFLANESDTEASTDHFIILSYLTSDTVDADDAASVFSDSASHKARPSQRPELRIVDVKSGEEVASDALSVTGFERYRCYDYRIARPPSGKPFDPFIVISPKDVVVVRKRDVEDHITWLCERNRYEEALQVIEEKGLKQSVFSKSAKGLDPAEIGKKFLNHLLEDGQYQKAASSCSKILGVNTKAWEDWIFSFVQKGHIQTIIPYVPTHDPQLSRLVYEMILAHFLQTNPAMLLSTLKTWPRDIYDSGAIINAVRSIVERGAKTKDVNMLMECLVELYLMNRQPGKSLPYYLRLRKPGVFDLIRDHSLFPDVQDQALLLVDFDQDMQRRRQKGISKAPIEAGKSKHGEAIDLLVDHTHSIPIPRVIDQLSGNRHYLYMYLDALFAKDPHIAYEYSDFQVDLYAEYDAARLMDFLRASNHYSLEKAYDICKKRDYVPEMVFLLGRMGNNKQALNLIIQRLGDVQRAIDFAKEQNDSDLWEDLLKYSETKPTFIRGLLENVGPEIDPIRLIRRIKNGLEIPGLKPALIKILQDFNIQISLIEGCRVILNADCRQLTLALHDGQTNAFFGSSDTTVCYKCNKLAFAPPNASNSTAASATPAEALSIIFLCRHVFHIGCALPDVELPSRPQHLMNPLLLGVNGRTGDKEGDGSRDIAAKILFASQLKQRAIRSQVACPECSSKRGAME